MASKSCNQLFTDKFPTVFKLFRHRVNASSDFATVTFFIVFKMCRHRVNAVLDLFFSLVIVSVLFWHMKMGGLEFSILKHNCSTFSFREALHCGPSL